MNISQKISQLRTIVVAVMLSGQLIMVAADGLPGEYTVTQRWRELFARYSALSNASFLTSENYVDARGTFFTVLNGTFKLWEAGVTIPIGVYQSSGLTWVHEGTDQYAEIINGLPTDRQITHSNDLFMLNYSINPWDALSVGLNANILSQNAFGSQRLGFGADLGANYRFLHSPAFGTHDFGIALQNIIAPSIGAETYSRNFRISLLSGFWEKRITSALFFDLKDLFAKAADFQEEITSGSFRDAAASLEWLFSGNIGFNILKIGDVRVLFGLNKTGLNYVGAGILINIPMANQGRDLMGGFQYSALTEDNIATQSAYLRGEIGEHREAWYARKMAQALDVAPNNIYLRAVQLHSQGKYWQAYFLFTQILNAYPDFFKSDWVGYYAANCQEHLDMRDAAIESYQTDKSDFPKSFAVPFADLGIMRILYRNNDLDGVTRQFKTIKESNAPDSILWHASYLMGQVFMSQKMYQSANDLFDRIPPEGTDYLFALHGAGVALLSQNKPLDASGYFGSALSVVPKTKAEEEIINRSNLMLGLIFYENLLNEEHYLSKSVILLRKVPKNSLYYEEAQLGLAWAAVKSRQFVDCGVATQILMDSKQRTMRVEGMLVQSYCKSLQRNLVDARTLLEQADALLKVTTAPSQDSLMSERQNYESQRVSYELLANRAADEARSLDAGATSARSDSLYAQQREIKARLDVSINWFDEFNRTTGFCRNLETLRSDVDYAYAVILKEIGASAATKETKKANEKVNDIDQQIQKLKEEMNKKGQDTGN